MNNDKTICPLCGNNANISHSEGILGENIKCENCGIFIIELEAENYIKTHEKETEFNVCLYYYLNHNKFKKSLLIINENTTESNKYEVISVDEILNLYPKSISEKIDMILLNLSILLKNPGACCTLNKVNSKNIFFADNDSEAYFLVDTMNKEFNYLKLEEIDDNIFTNIELTYRGWNRIDEISKNKKKYKKGFIAMWFDPSMNPIRKVIKDVFVETGYQISIIDEKEHNNQIVQEILYEIETSDFIVADLTGNRGGVYYEAGYALGLGKELILIVDNNWLEKNKENPHFDVAQKNQIRYISIDDLSVRLFNRITSTVGNLKNPNSPLKSLKTNDE